MSKTPAGEPGSMAPNEPDKVQREIEELLGKLDNFVPEERLVSKIKSRQKAAAGPGFTDRLLKRVSHITLGHVMLTGLALLLISSFAPLWVSDSATPGRSAGGLHSSRVTPEEGINSRNQARCS